MEVNQYNSNVMEVEDEERGTPCKRPHLLVDTSRDCQPLCEALSSGTDSFSSFGGAALFV